MSLDLDPLQIDVSRTLRRVLLELPEELVAATNDLPSWTDRTED